MNASLHTGIVGACKQSLDEITIQGGRYRKQELVFVSEERCCLQDSRQIHANFFSAASRHESDPRLRKIKPVPGCVFLARNVGAGKLCQGMSDELGIDAPITIELLFKREDYQRLIDILAQEPYPSLSPCPELRADVVNDRDTTFLHLARNSPVECRRVNDDGEIRPPLVCFNDQFAK